MRLESFPYLTQTDNKWFSSTTCYPTSMAMAMSYCLGLVGKDKSAVGCLSDIQLEDFITEITESAETKQWIKSNVSKFGSYLLDYKPRVLAVVEEMIFNKLMNPLGFKTKFSDQISYDDFCNHIENEQMPIVIHGDFSSVSAVVGHITCGVGFDKDKGTIFVHDPYGNALRDKYKSHEGGVYAEYPQSLLMRDKKNKKIWGQMISKV